MQTRHRMFPLLRCWLAAARKLAYCHRRGQRALFVVAVSNLML